MVSKALTAASTKPIILSILFNGENYGYQIIQNVKRVSGGTLEWSDAMLYPVLHRLEKDEFVSSQWKLSKEGRRRKYYKLTELGKKELEVDVKQWMSVHRALSKLLKPLPIFD